MKELLGTYNVKKERKENELTNSEDSTEQQTSATMIEHVE